MKLNTPTTEEWFIGAISITTLTLITLIICNLATGLNILWALISCAALATEITCLQYFGYRKEKKYQEITKEWDTWYRTEKLTHP